MLWPLLQELPEGLKLGNKGRQAISPVHACEDRLAFKEPFDLQGLLLHLVAVHHLGCARDTKDLLTLR